MTTMTDYREALAQLRRFIDDPAFRQKLSKDFEGFGLSPQDIMIEELAAIGLRCLEARTESRSEFTKARQALKLVGCPASEEGCRCTHAGFINQFAVTLDQALAFADACRCGEIESGKAAP